MKIITPVCIVAIALTSAVTYGAAAGDPGRCCGPGNLAQGKPTTASSEELSKKNIASQANDGDVRTRWCAQGGASGQWWQVDLGKAEHVRSLRIHWEAANVPYRYRVDASADAQSWRTIVDQSKNNAAKRITPHELDSPNTRYLKVTFLGAAGHLWGSFWEFEAYPGPLPSLPAGLNDAPAAAAADTLPGTKVVVNDQKFDVTRFAGPPEVNYPVCLAAAPTGEVFVGVDQDGSLGKRTGFGKIVRCLDVDGDGRADRFTEFAKVDHPRGLVYDNGSLWILHPPHLSLYRDANLDGVADSHSILITGISTDQVAKRGADHTTNGIRQGIDGWIYIAVGDFGFSEARGADGTTLRRRGGGVVRVRPDGTELEIYAWGLRNIVDVCVDPFLNIFTRDNTNDGGGWNVRFSHVVQSAEYGYPSLYINFPDEIMPPLADYGGGSGTGGLFLHDLGWPAVYGNAAYTCDWGRSEVYCHPLTAAGATFIPSQQAFLKIPLPTDIDIDGSGRMYVSSWHHGGFSYSGPNVGFVAQVVPQGSKPKPFPDLGAAPQQQLMAWLASPSGVTRLHSQRELLRRGRSASCSAALRGLAADSGQPLPARVAALFTLKQLDGASSHPVLVKLAEDATVREFALRALTDRKSELAGLPLELFTAALNDPNARVRAQALISLGRLGRAEAATAILPLTQRAADSPSPSAKPLHAQPDPDRVIPHLAQRTLETLGAADTCVQALDGPFAEGALASLKYMHQDAAVEGLLRHLGKTRDSARRQAVLVTLIRLYHREGDYRGDWWGTRPDTSGPYYDRQTWAQSAKIGRVIRTAILDADPTMAQALLAEVARQKVSIDGLPKPTDLSALGGATRPTVAVPKVDPKNPNQIANIPYAEAVRRVQQSAGNVEQGRALFTLQSCVACHTSADGQVPKGPHLVDIGKRYQRAELIESVLQPSAKLAQGFESYEFLLIDGRSLSGFVINESAEAVQVGQTDGSMVELKKSDIEERRKLETSMMPVGLVSNLTPEQLADLMAYLESLQP
jgi:putative heme-binding domain-containing protein